VEVEWRWSGGGEEVERRWSGGGVEVEWRWSRGGGGDSFCEAGFGVFRKSIN